MNKILAALAGIAAVVAVFFRGQSARHKADAARARERANSAEASAGLHQRIDGAMADIKNKHRVEQIDAQSRFDAGDRDQLDNNW